MRHLTLLICSLALAAPVPRDLPPPEVTPGDYATRWNNSPWEYTLSTDGTCVGSAGGCRYVGIWSWDSKRRELMLTETNNQWQTWKYYLFRLDSKMVGTCIESSTNGEPDDTPSSVIWRVSNAR